MTKLSKISRSIIVVIFVAVLVFLEYQNIMLSVNNIEGNLPIGFIKIPGWAKFLYVISIAALVILYVYIKEKLYKKKVKRNIALIFRYIYLVIVGSLATFITLMQVDQNLKTSDKLIFVVISVLTGILIKKIVFNVSKSDILSVIGMIAYVSIIDILNVEEIYISKFICLFVACTIYVMQIVIDEIKQRGIKNNKYCIFSAILGICIGISVVSGVHASVYIILAFLIFFIGSNLDNAHITFPRKAMEDISKEKREFLFKIERINISKLLISVIITAIIAILVAFGVYCLIKYTAIEETKNLVLSNILDRFGESFKITPKFNFTTFIDSIRSFIIMSKTYYFTIILYILFMEVLAFLLKRRYDTKSTVMKVIFVCVIVSIVVFELNINIYQPLITTMLIMIAIVNTSNIYLNREERVKLLVA